MNTPPASPVATNQGAPAKPDYGWLTALMAQWIEDLNKQYPATLRADGIQGKVTLTAMLHEDGLLSDVRIVKSSGNPALDHVALEDVKNGPPIKLSRPLERHQMPVKFSISYDLKTAR
ncbi:MAG: energy transducer TonB [Nitrospira sp.]|nr:energy transducer TonB [Nitrospira sp.]